ncbi:MAG: ribosome-associated translation inhibitor RaiA [Victivallales bacterium]|nr:ribosome-associated translation inhibitor RaiA [Victivallales bacterium]
MQIIIAGRHFTVTESLKADINGRLEGILGNIRLKITTVRVILEIEKMNRCNAEVVVNLKNSVIEANVSTRDMYEAIDTVMDKIAVQVRKYLDKKQQHHSDVSIKNIPEKDAAGERSAGNAYCS